jgi:hypothetical protein
LLIRYAVSKLVLATRARIDQSEGLRLALLSGLSFVLGIVFLGMLVSDQAHAAGL